MIYLKSILLAVIIMIWLTSDYVQTRGISAYYHPYYNRLVSDENLNKRANFRLTPKKFARNFYGSGIFADVAKSDKFIPAVESSSNVMESQTWNNPNVSQQNLIWSQIGQLPSSRLLYTAINEMGVDSLVVDSSHTDSNLLNPYDFYKPRLISTARGFG